MSTATFTLPARRFAWKEYRTLRGLWLAVAALAIIVQAISALFAAPGTDLPAWLFGTALAAAALYAVGAAAILFAVEHEDETYNFLTGLPVTWLPVFAGKLLVAATSALALAITLLLTGCAISGGHWPSSIAIEQLSALFGLALVEAIVWGTFFSLLVRRPLVAAILTIFFGTIAIQWAASMKSSGDLGAADLAAYSASVPIRLSIVASILVASIFVARNWLSMGARPINRSRSSASALRFTMSLSRVRRSLSRTQVASTRTDRRQLLVRLLWQSWRQSWKMLLLPLPVAIFLLFGATAVRIAIPSMRQHVGTFFVIPALFLPALFGALIFSGDQRRRQFRFLAEHAARPRYVWLARHVVWGSALAAVLAFWTTIAVFISSVAFVERVHQFAQFNSWQYQSRDQIVNQLSTPLRLLTNGISLGAFGCLLAYAIGQFFSMLVRSEIMAAFLACVASVIVTAWCTLMLGWGLSGTLFVLPIAVGFLAATWLRAPAWIAERNSWHSWLPAVVAIVMPVAVAMVLLPSERLAQIPPMPPPLNAQETIATVRARYRAGDTSQARETAAMYYHAADLLDSWQEHDPLERWSEYEIGGLGTPFRVDDIDISKIPPAELEEFERAKLKHDELKQAAAAAAMDEFLAASRRPTCRFQFDLSLAPLRNSYPTTEELEKARIRLDPRYQRLIRLTTRLANANVANDKAVDHYLAGLRACAHLRSGQPTLVFIDQLGMERSMLERIVEWAKYGGLEQAHMQIPEPSQVRDAIERLTSYFAVAPNPAESYVADHDLVLDVLFGRQLPLIFAYPPIEFDTHWAYLFHKLPWERERALRELEETTASDIRRTIGLLQFIDDGVDRNDWPRNFYEVRAYLEPATQSRYAAAQSESLIPGFITLAGLEYHARVHSDDLNLALVDTEMYRRATLIQLAIELYRRDHDCYPESLADLAPDYLNRVPVDPFSGQPFHFLPAGIDQPVVDALPTNHDIEPSTPFFWSVGPQNFTKLVRLEDTWTERDADHPNAEPIEHKRAVYRFWPDNWSWYWGSVRGVFPLPKCERPLPPQSSDIRR